jgi:exodeoxyribonuclease V alpha subunit
LPLRVSGGLRTVRAVTTTLTLTGEVERITFENEETSFRVIRVGSVQGQPGLVGPITVVGTFRAVGPGTRVRVTGQFVRDPRHGEQFRVDTLIPVEPTTVEGLEKYLGSGMIPGVGPGFARRIVRTFGLDTLEILDKDPGRLRQVPGLGERRIDAIRTSWSARRALNSIMLLLQTHGASAALALRIYKHYGDRAAAVVERSPYRLALEVRGIGFLTADRLARSLGISGDHPERAQAGVWHELGELAEAGHTVVPRAHLVERTAAMLEIGPDHVEAATDALWASGRVVCDDLGVSLARLYDAERSAAEALARLATTCAGDQLEGVATALEVFEREAGLTLARAQIEAVETVARRKVVIITGGPGVGKTTLVRAVLSVMTRARLDVRLAAPTGRAAKRLSEATGRLATTLHRLLEFEPRSGRFARDADHPLETDALIVDEASMVDVALAAALTTALPATARLVLVGDVDQLPSVGPGAFLRDAIDSGVVDCVRLNEIFRQAEQSRIVQNAHRILRGEMPRGSRLEQDQADFFVIPRKDPEEAAKLVEEIVVHRIPRRFRMHAVDDVQVLCPMHRGPAGTVALNHALQQRLNPEGDSLVSRGQTLRVGDKVMQTRNDYEREVFNGDTGRIVAVETAERRLVVRVDERDVAYEEDDIEALTLAYATSIHKSQGSEYPAVVVPVLASHFVMLSRNLIYTAVTRARRLCVLIADPRALGIALGETRREQRSTRLKGLLVAAHASSEATPES